MKNHAFLLLILPLLVLMPAPIFADEESDKIAALERQVELLSKAVNKLQGVVESQSRTIQKFEQQPHNVAAPIASSPPSLQPQSNPVAPRVLQQINPEIGVVADIVGKLTESPDSGEGNDQISVRELELVFGADIDPYARFDSTIAFSDSEDPHLEEAYVTYLGLPLDVQAKIGRMRPRVGIAATQHRDSLDTVDEPFVVRDLFGEEGYSRSGLELSHYLNVPWENVTHEVIGGILEGGTGHEGTLFGSNSRAPTLYGRLKNSWDISDRSLLNLGTTFLTGSSDDDTSFEARAVGVDLAYTHAFNSVQKIKFISEGYLQDRSAGYSEEEEEAHTHSLIRHEGESDEHLDHEDDEHTDEEEHEEETSLPFRTNPFGFYSLVDYRFAQRWSAGARYDYSESINLDTQENKEIGYTGYVSFFQSEFARWRFQYQLAEQSDGSNDNRFFLQLTTAIGTHKHNIQ